jgi:hypothetical protein
MTIYIYETSTLWALKHIFIEHDMLLSGSHVRIETISQKPGVTWTEFYACNQTQLNQP